MDHHSLRGAYFFMFPQWRPREAPRGSFPLRRYLDRMPLEEMSEEVRNG